MPITITLSDDAAAEIMKQITEGLTKRTVPATPEPIPADVLYSRGVEETFSAVENLAPGATIHVARFAQRLGVPTDSISNTIQRLKRSGMLEMVQKGTWRKVAPPVARAV